MGIGGTGGRGTERGLEAEDVDGTVELDVLRDMGLTDEIEVGVGGVGGGCGTGRGGLSGVVVIVSAPGTLGDVGERGTATALNASELALGEDLVDGRCGVLAALSFTFLIVSRACL